MAVDKIASLTLPSLNDSSPSDEAGDTRLTLRVATGDSGARTGVETEGDRICIDALARDPILRFEVDADTQALRTVKVDRETGLVTPLTTGITPGDITETLLERTVCDPLAGDPILRYWIDEDTGILQTQFLDRETGEVVWEQPDETTIKRDAALREFAERAFVNKSV